MKRKVSEKAPVEFVETKLDDSRVIYLIHQRARDHGQPGWRQASENEKTWDALTPDQKRSVLKDIDGEACMIDIALEDARELLREGGSK